MREIAQHKQRIQKVLEDANVKLASVVLTCLVRAGDECSKRSAPAKPTPGKALAALRDGRLSASRETLAGALQGKVTAHHRFLLSQHLRMIDSSGKTIRDFEGQIEVVIAPFRAAVANLVTIPGISTTAAQMPLSRRLASI